MEKIAVVRRNGLGDLLCAFPLILYLKKSRKASVTLFVDQRNAPLIRYLPPVDEVVIFPSKGMKYWNLLRVAFKYRKKFDRAISAKTSPMKLMNFFLYCLGAKERIAYVDDSWHSCLINKPIQFDATAAKKEHQALKGLKTVAPEMQEIPPEFFPTLQVPEAMREKYKLDWKLTPPILVVSATTTREASRFDPLRYARLINRLYMHYPFSVLIIGQKNDRERAEAIAVGLQMEHRVHFPRNFDEFMVLLERSDLFFVGDGGVAHIGAAFDKPVVALFGETNPNEWRPLGKKVEVFFHPEHVNHLSDEAIFQALKRRMQDVEGVKNSGRDNL